MSFWGEYEQSRDATTGMLKRALVGGALARGNTEGAAREAYRLGDYQAGAQIGDLGRQDAQRQRNVTIGQAAARGDYPGAKRIALEAGDLKTAADVDAWIDQQDKDVKAAMAERSDAQASAAYALRSMPNDPTIRRQALLTQYGPQLLQLGFTEQQLQSIPLDDASLDGIYKSALTMSERLALDLKEREAQWRQEDREEDNRRQADRDDDIAEYRRGQLGLSNRRESRVAAGSGRGGGGSRQAAPASSGAPWEKYR